MDQFLHNRFKNIDFTYKNVTIFFYAVHGGTYQKAYLKSISTLVLYPPHRRSFPHNYLDAGRFPWITRCT